MAKRQKDWARRKRRELKKLLGNVCNVPSCNETKNLEFDCILPNGDTHHKYDTSHRMSFYTNQFKQNNLQLLCPKHHERKSKSEHPHAETTLF